MDKRKPPSWTLVEKAISEFENKIGRKLSLSILATMCSVGKASLSDWKNGKTLPEDRTARAVAQVVNMDFEELRLLLVEERYQRELSAADDRRRIQTSGMRVDIGHVGIVPERPAVTRPSASPIPGDVTPADASATHISPEEMDDDALRAWLAKLEQGLGQTQEEVEQIRKVLEDRRKKERKPPE